MTGAAADPERVAFGWPGCPGWSTGTLGVAARHRREGLLVAGAAGDEEGDRDRRQGARQPS